jgi:hypothetical protein
MLRLSIFTITLFAFVTPAGAADDAAKRLAPFIDRDTLLVARLDVRGFDLAAFVGLLQPVAPNAEAANASGATARAWQEAFVKKGGREIYLVFGPGDFPHGPCLLTPVGETPPERKDLAELLRMIYENQETASAYVGGFLCVGPKETVVRLKRRKASDRPELAEALASATDAPFQLAFAPGADARKIFEQIAPSLPEEVGGGSVEALTRGLRWACLSVGPAPKFEARFVIQAADADAAAKLCDAAAKGIAGAKALFRGVDEKEQAAFDKLYRRAAQLAAPKLEKDRVVFATELGAAVPELLGMIKEIQPAARSLSSNNLKQLGIACHNYASAYGDRLPANITDKDGKPLLSWRVAILPYIEQGDLYQKFKLDEPWDSEHNKKLIPLMPKTLHSPKQAEALKDRTTYLAPLGKGLMWDDPKGVRFQDVPDGTSNTILLVEAGDESAVIWTKPDDLKIDMKEPTKGLLGHYGNGFLAAMADGSVRLVDKDYSSIWSMFTRDGGEVLPEK